MSKKELSKIETKITQHPIGYKGEVKLKLLKGKVPVKEYDINNSGTLNLFSSIANFLIGRDPANEYDGSMPIPQYLGLGYQNTKTDTDPAQSSLFNEYNIPRIRLDKGTPTINQSAGYYYVTFTATILYSEVGGSPISELGLFGSYAGSNLLARVTIPKQGDSGTEGIILPVGMNLLVEWNVIIGNMN